MKNCNTLTLVFVYGESNCLNKKTGKGSDFHLLMNSMSLVPREQPVLGRNFVQCRQEIIQCPEPRKTELLTSSPWVPLNMSVYGWNIPLKTQRWDYLP